MKMAKRSLAVLLALLMAFSVFSVSGSALWNDGDAGVRAESTPGLGTITYGVDIYKDGTKVENGSTLSPGDLVEVRVSFGTDFYTSFISAPVYFDSTYFDLAIDGVVKTDKTDGFLAGLIKTYDGQVKTSDEITNASGQPSSFYDTLLSEANGGRICQNNKMTSRDYIALFPLFMKKGYAEGTAKMNSAMATEYAKYNEVITQFGTGLGNNANDQIIKVPYDCYFSFQLKVKDGADSNGATTSLGIPLLALRTAGSDPVCQMLKSTSADSSDINAGVKTQYGHGYDMRNAEFTCVIGAAAPEACAHDWGEGTVNIAATCTTDGEMLYTCSKCNETKTEVIPATGHTEETIPGKAATCTETGLTDGVKCSVCGEILTAQEVIPALGHAYDATVTTEPTCTTDGVKTFTCKNCGDTYTEAIPAKGHTWGDWTVVKEATATEEGLEERVCSVCGEKESRPIEKLPVAKLELTESRNGTTGTELNVTVPYGGRNKVAFALTSSVEGTKYEVKSNGKRAAFKIDENGNVKFVRMSILSKNKTATIVATSPDGQVATCKVTYKMKWWQYLVWLIFGTFWF